MILQTFGIAAAFAAPGSSAPAAGSPFEDPVSLNILDPRPEEDGFGPQEESAEDFALYGYTVVTSDGRVDHVDGERSDWKGLVDRPRTGTLEEGAASGAREEADETEKSILSDLPNGAPVVRVADDDIANLPYRLAGRFRLGCSGTMIGRRQILTAAHCVHNIKSGKYHSQRPCASASAGTARRRPGPSLKWTGSMFRTATPFRRTRRSTMLWW